MVLHQALRQIGRNHALRAACLLVLLFLPMTGPASDGLLTLTWDSNTEPDIAGYKLHYGTNPRSYTTHIDVGLNTAYTLRDLEQGTYYFAITAYNRSGAESAYSNEIVYSVTLTSSPTPTPIPAPAPAPSVTGVSAASGPVGMEIAILGDNLVKGTAVDFGGVRAPLILLTPQKAVAAVPDGFSSGPVTVTTPGGSAVATHFTVTNPQTGADLTIPGGGTAEYSTIGPSSRFQAGYATATSGGGTTPYGMASLSYSQGGTVSSAVTLTAGASARSARMLVDHRLQSPAGKGVLDIKTGFSIVNPGPGDAGLNVVLRNSSGDALQAKTLNLAQGEHLARFVDELFGIPDDFGLGTLDISSDQPVFVLALRMTLNQSGILFMSEIPIADLTEPAAAGPLYFPRMAAGSGWDTTVLLFNTSDRRQTGEIHILTESGILMNAANDGTTVTTSPYSISPGGVFRLPITDSSGAVKAGWIKIVPDAGTLTPAGAELIGLTKDGILIAETCFPATSPVRRALLYVDESDERETVFAIANPGSSPVRIEARALQANVQAGTGQSVDIPANGAVGSYVNDLFRDSLPEGFKGIVEFSSTEPFLPISLRTLLNSHGNYVFANVPVVDPALVAPAPIVFPQIADGGGYLTELIFVNPGNDSSGLQLGFEDSHGNSLAVGR